MELHIRANENADLDVELDPRAYQTSTIRGIEHTMLHDTMYHIGWIRFEYNKVWRSLAKEIPRERERSATFCQPI